MLLEQTILLIGVTQAQMTHQQKMVVHQVQLVMLLLTIMLEQEQVVKMLV